MVYRSWYPEIRDLMKCLGGMRLQIPVVHCEKTLGERLCGRKVWYEDGQYKEYIMTPEEDMANFENGLSQFAINLEVANALGAEKMVLHLWNGLPSDKDIEKNIERFAKLQEMATAAGALLLVENRKWDGIYYKI